MDNREGPYYTGSIPHDAPIPLYECLKRIDAVKESRKRVQQIATAFVAGLSLVAAIQTIRLNMWQTRYHELEAAALHAKNSDSCLVQNGSVDEK